MTDHSAMRLGLLPPRLGLAAPGMARFGVALPQASPECHWGRAVSPDAWGMDRNNLWGTCTVAAADHAQRAWHANVQAGMRVMTDSETMANYTAVNPGFDPADPSTDRGAVLSDVMLHWQRTGFTMGGAVDQIQAFVRLNIADDNELRLAVQWFGCAIVGLNLPLSAQTQSIWDASPGQPGEPWGGHAVAVVGHDPDLLTGVSWGAIKPMTWRFWRACGTEAWAVLSTDWMERSGRSPGGIDLAGLQSDLAEMASG